MLTDRQKLRWRWCLILLPYALGVRAADGVIAYWDADRPCSEWRDSQWQKGGSGRLHFDTDQRRHGVASVRLEGTPDQEISISSVCALIPVKEDGRYVLRFWSRRVGPNGTAVCQVLAHRRVDDQRSAPIGWVRLAGADRLPIALGDTWQPHEVPVTALPGGTARLYVYFRVNGDTTLWIDEFSLATEGVQVQLGGGRTLSDADYAGIRFDDTELPADLMQNGSFEEGMAHWQPMNSDIAVAVDDTRAGLGKHSLRLHGVEFAAGGVYQRVRIDPRRRYRLTLRGAGDAYVGYLFTKVLRFDREDHPRGWLGDEILFSARDAAWVERSVEFDPTPSTDNVVVYLRVEDTIGDVWVDAVRLVPLPRSAKGGAP